MIHPGNNRRKMLQNNEKQMSFQKEKDLVKAFYEDLQLATNDKLADVMGRFCAPNLLWRGFHPFGQISGVHDVAENFWAPLRNSLKRMQRRQDIFFAGCNSLTDEREVWVVSMGHLMGLFDQLLVGHSTDRQNGIPALLRVQQGARRQDRRDRDVFRYPASDGAGWSEPVSAPTAAHLVQPGPLTHDGILIARINPPKKESRLWR